MKSSLAVLAAAGALSGCYVIPIDPAHPLPVGVPPHAAAIVPATQPVPSVLHARLYPLNETAGKTGALTAVVSDNANGHATFSLNYAGELLQGEASRVSASYPGFGKIHREVYNGSGAMPTGQRGIASAAGARGTYVNCEYAFASANRGTGACIFSNGAKYQLHFGS
jgi:hypothetical protein